MSDKKKLEVQTTETKIFKQIIERISGVIAECYLVFIQPTKKNKGGAMVVQDISDEKNVYVNLQLKSENFEIFECKEDVIKVGVNLQNLFKIMQFVSNNVPITFIMYKNDNEKIYINDKLKFNLTEINSNRLPVPVIKNTFKFTMKAATINSEFKKFFAIMDVIDIKLGSGGVIFKGKCEIGEVEREIECVDYEKGHVTGTYDLKNLLLFTKNNDFCHDVIEFYIGKDAPLILIFEITSLGTMQIFLTPLNN